MIITKQFILKYQTDKGAWTQPQLESLGVSWPPVANWKQRVIGTEISEENRLIFMSRITVDSFRKNQKRVK